MEATPRETPLAQTQTSESTLLFPEPVPTLQTIMAQQSENTSLAAAGLVDESMLSAEEKEKIDQFASEIDLTNIDQTLSYGSAAQKNITDFSTVILKKADTRDLGPVGDSLRELTIALDATSEPEKKGFLGLFQKGKRAIGAIKANYAKAESNVKSIERDLQQHQVVLTQDIAMYQQMYELNQDYYKQLTLYIIAGKKALHVARNGKLLELQERAKVTNRQEDAHAYQDFHDQCVRFEKRLSDLEITRMVSVQSAVKVRVLQNSNREQVDNIQSVLANTIPLWRNQLAVSIGLEHSRRAVEAQRALSDKTNELLMKNAESLRMSAVETAKEAERPIVDMETLRKCNRELIASINEVMKIHEQGSAQREKAHEELVAIESELKQALLEAGSR